MKRRFVRQNLLSTAFATAAFAAPNLARAFAQSLGHYGSPLPRFYDALAHSIADSGLLPRPARSPRPLYPTRAADIRGSITQVGSLCSNPVMSICLVRKIR
jgi:hypothetical protein